MYLFNRLFISGFRFLPLLCSHFVISRNDKKSNKNVLIKPKALALIGAASFFAGVRHKRYSGQQETAPENCP
ncbi:hypothetical protein RC62_2469 [Flavobacterium aquidurense]|uniref:Uncharacterized protein n=1 Tax=Flavobacterium aquidurense TaxID=362413 RepID=A0A0Q0RMS9_9FLAO|nr:hypothetical protein RC62_2469 [Flavobacterium aquidurense]